MSEKIMVNLHEQLKEAGAGGSELFHYNGGWIKTITALDKTKDDGFSLVGEFVRSEERLAYQDAGLYVDCSIEGSRNRHSKVYTLFDLTREGVVRKIATVYGKDWAVKLWPDVEGWMLEQAAASTAARPPMQQAILDKIAKAEADIKEWKALLEQVQS